MIDSFGSRIFGSYIFKDFVNMMKLPFIKVIQFTLSPVVLKGFISLLLDTITYCHYFYLYQNREKMISHFCFDLHVFDYYLLYVYYLHLFFCELLFMF